MIHCQNTALIAYLFKANSFNLFNFMTTKINTYILIINFLPPNPQMGA